MDKQLLPSIEEFAAYLDGNLSHDEMMQFSNLAAKNQDIMNLLDANAAIEETLADYDDADMHLPEEIAGWDFKLPEIENIDDFSLAADSLPQNESLYQQKDIQIVEKILDDVFDDEDSETVDIDDLDMDLDTEIFDDF